MMKYDFISKPPFKSASSAFYLDDTRQSKGLKYRILWNADGYDKT
jgi:hypothetical protein